MKPNTLTSKILSLILAGGLFSGIVVLFLAQSRMKKVVNQNQYEVYDEKLRTIIHVLKINIGKLKATGMRDAYEEDFQELTLKTLRSTYYTDSGQRIYPFIINAEREIVLHPVLPRGDKSLKDTPYLKSMVQLENGEIDYKQNTLEEEWCVFKKFDEWNWFIGYTIPLDIKYADVHQLMSHITLSLSLIGTVVIALVSFIIAKILRPIRLLTNASRAMAEGNLEYRIDTGQTDELGLLSNTFEGMRSAIHEKIEALSQSEERFRILFNNISNAVFLHDSDGHVLDVNQTMTQLYGVTREEALSMDIPTHFSGPGTHPETLPDIWQHVQNGETVALEWNAKKPHSGECFPVDVLLKSVQFGNKSLILSTVRDLSRQKEAEKQVLKEKKFSETIIQTLPGIFYIYEDGERLIQWNDNFERVSGYTHDELLHKRITDWFSENDKLLILDMVQNIFQGKDASIEASLMTKNKRLPYYLTGTLLTIDSKKYLVGVGLDISKRIELEEELAQAQKMEAIGTLAGGIAHDFNNILSAIYGYAELAKLTDNRDDIQSFISEVLIAARRAKELVKQILTFSRKTAHEKQPLELALILKEALKLLRPTIPTTINIKQEIDSTAVVLADPTKIHQVIMNLCTNAYHAMRDTGGTLAVTLKETELKESNTEQIDKKIPPGHYLKLEVSDTGCGMDEKTKSKIFEPYFTTKSAGEGTGLGLAVVYGIVDDHHGTIHVYSEPGKGTSFHVYLPIVDEHSKDFSLRDSAEQEVDAHGEYEKIMIVDDEETISRILVRILSENGYRTKAFQNGVQALQEFKKNKDQYDLVITDMTMPYMTGIDLAKEILEISPEMPIILNSGLSESINKDKALAVGIRAYCEKPIEIDALLRVVRNTLKQRNSG